MPKRASKLARPRSSMVHAQRTVPRVLFPQRALGVAAPAQLLPRRTLPLPVFVAHQPASPRQVAAIGLLERVVRLEEGLHTPLLRPHRDRQYSALDLLGHSQGHQAQMPRSRMRRPSCRPNGARRGQVPVKPLHASFCLALYFHCKYSLDPHDYMLLARGIRLLE